MGSGERGSLRSALVSAVGHRRRACEHAPQSARNVGIHPTSVDPHPGPEVARLGRLREFVAELPLGEQPRLAAEVAGRGEDVGRLQPHALLLGGARCPRPRCAPPSPPAAPPRGAPPQPAPRGRTGPGIRPHAQRAGGAAPSHRPPGPGPSPGKPPGSSSLQSVRGLREVPAAVPASPLCRGRRGARRRSRARACGGAGVGTGSRVRGARAPAVRPTSRRRLGERLACTEGPCSRG